MTRKRNQIAPQNSRNSTVERRKRQRAAFIEVLGDPGEQKRNIEPVDGWYQTFKTRGPIAAMRNNFDQSATAKNPATPSIVDFFCDVETAVKDAITNQKELQKFWDVFVLVAEEPDEWLTPSLRNRFQQTIGRLFVKRKISPVSKYFIAVRTKRKH
jgi:hypothetical protein